MGVHSADREERAAVLGRRSTAGEHERSNGEGTRGAGRVGVIGTMGGLAVANEWLAAADERLDEA